MSLLSAGCGGGEGCVRVFVGSLGFGLICLQGAGLKYGTCSEARPDLAVVMISLRCWKGVELSLSLSLSLSQPAPVLNLPPA